MAAAAQSLVPSIGNSNRLQHWRLRPMDEQYLSMDMYHEHISILALKDNCPSTFFLSVIVSVVYKSFLLPLLVRTVVYSM